MNIIELANTVKDGDEVRRESWLNDEAVLVYNNDEELFYTKVPWYLYDMTKQDLAATDWYIVKKESKATLALKEFNSGKPILVSQEEEYKAYFMAGWNAALDELLSMRWEDVGPLLGQKITKLKETQN